MSANRILVLFPTPFEADGFRPAAEVTVGVSGVGSRSAAFLTRWLTQNTTQQVMLAGFAGGLTDALKRGDLVTLSASSHPSERIASVEHICAQASDKRALRASTGADIVEMEYAPVFAVCQKAGLPLTVVRVISDSVNDDVPVRALSQGFDTDTGRETPLRFVRHCLGHPKDIPAIVRFLGPLKRVRDQLHHAVTHQVVAFS